MKKKKFPEREKVYALIISILLFFRFIFDGITYPVFNLFFTLSLISLFVSYLFFKSFKINLTYSEIFLFAFLIFSIISSFLSEIKGTGVRFNAYIISYLLIFLLLRNITEEKNKRDIIIRTILIATFLINIYGIYQRFWGFEETRRYFLMQQKLLIEKYPDYFQNISPTFIDRLKSNRIFSTFIYPNIYASFLISLMPFLFFNFLNGYKDFWGVFSIFLFFLSFFCLILTESMGGLLVFLFVFHIIFLYLILDGRIFKKLIPFLLLSEFLFLIFGYKLKILPHIHSLVDRTFYWKSTLKIILLKPLFGIGSENFKYYFLKFKLPFCLEAKHAHSLFLELLSENGIIGFVLFSIFLFLLIKNSLKENNFFSRGVFFLLISFLLHNLIDFDFSDPSIAILPFIFGGTIGKRDKILSERLTKGIVCIIIFLSIAGGFKLFVFENSERYKNLSRKSTNINEKLYLLEVAEKWDSKNFEIYVERGDLFLSMWQITRDDRFSEYAIDNYKTALLFNPYLTKVYLKMANLYESLNNYKEAEKMYLKLVELYPNKKLYNLEVAGFYKRIGEKEKFEYYYEKSKNLKEVTTEEGILTREIEKWIELQK